MKQFLKKNWALVLAFAGPILFIGVLIVIAYFPRPMVITDYNFVYTISEWDRWADEKEVDIYTVKDEKIVAVPDTDEYRSRIRTIWLYDSTNHESQELSLEEAEKLTISSKKTSPDGVKISTESRRGGGSLFFFNDYYYNNDSYLVFEKNGRSSKINISYYDYENFLGWVIKQ